MTQVEFWIKRVPLSQVAVVSAEVRSVYGVTEFVPNVSAIRSACLQTGLNFEDALYEVEARLDRINTLH